MKIASIKRISLVAAVALQPVIAAAQQAELEEVTVTAERRAENLQTTPIAVSALGADDLERLQVGSITDLDTAVPSMTIESNVASNAAVTVSMRGNAEQNAAFLFSEPGIGLYLDGVYRRLSGSNIELADIERIEVLRGPQGTLFGRNTLAGAINIVTRAPSDTLAGSLQLGYGAYDTKRIRAAVSGPIAGGFKGSLSVLDQERSDGWMTNRVNGAKVGTNKFLGAMGALAYEADAFDAKLTVYASNNESDGAFSAPVSVTTGRLVYPDRSIVGSASVTAGGRTTKPFNDTDQSGADLVLTFKLGDATLKSITAYSKLLDDWAVDFTAAQLAAPTPMGPFDAVPGTSGFFRVALADQSQVSQEFNLTYSADRLETIAGLFYYHEKSTQLVQDYFAGGFFAGVPANHHLDSTSYAAYLQANYKLADRWTLVAGGRYNDDQKKFTGRKANALSVPTNFASDRSFNRFSGKLGVEFSVNSDLFTYLTFSQGYKAGTYDPFASAEIIAQGINEETVDSLEFGLKAELLDRTLRLNSALFMTRYKDLAIGTITPTGILTRNAGESEVKGLETELTWLATDHFRVFGNLTLLDAKWRSLAPEALLTGVKLTDAPPFTYDMQASIGAAYEVPLSTGSLRFSATGRHIDSYYQQVAHLNNPLDRVNARDWVDTSAAFETSDGRHRVVLNIKNVTDEQGSFSALNFSTFLFNNTAAWLPGEPRTWELNYTYSLK
jgi:iron complex outermembrane receptor protein